MAKQLIEERRPFGLETKRPRPKVIRRFFDHVDIGKRNGKGLGVCWQWGGYCSPKGYGQFKWNNRAYWAHRVSYAIFFGSVPDGVDVHHVCHNPSCVNPDHLELLDRETNASDAGYTPDDTVPF